MAVQLASDMSSLSADTDSVSSLAETVDGKPAAGHLFKNKPSYKHVPHSQKPPHLVAKRNARERKRVQAVNNAFLRLRKSVPVENRGKRISKVKTLQRAIDYIRKLERILAADEADQQDLVSSSSQASVQTHSQPARASGRASKHQRDDCDVGPAQRRGRKSAKLAAGSIEEAPLPVGLAVVQQLKLEPASTYYHCPSSTGAPAHQAYCGRPSSGPLAATSTYTSSVPATPEAHVYSSCLQTPPNSLSQGAALTDLSHRAPTQFSGLAAYTADSLNYMHQPTARYRATGPLAWSTHQSPSAVSTSSSSSSSLGLCESPAANQQQVNHYLTFRPAGHLSSSNFALAAPDNNDSQLAFRHSSALVGGQHQQQQTGGESKTRETDELLSASSAMHHQQQAGQQQPDGQHLLHPSQVRPPLLLLNSNVDQQQQQQQQINNTLGSTVNSATTSTNADANLHGQQLQLQHQYHQQSFAMSNQQQQQHHHQQQQQHHHHHHLGAPQQHLYNHQHQPQSSHLSSTTPLELQQQTSDEPPIGYSI